MPPIIEEGSGILKTNKRKDRYTLVDLQKYIDNAGEGILVPHDLVHRFKLVEGADITGLIKKTDRGYFLQEIKSVCGLTPQQFMERTSYTQLVALPPSPRFKLSVTNEPSMRIVDLIAPIAKGTRGLIVSPPRAGKTILLEQIAKAIHVFDPKTRIIVLLVDERPEEVTNFRRQVQAEVLASSNDRDTRQHIQLTQLVMSHVTTELECGNDVVILVDSLTRMARAYNLGGYGGKQNRGRIMSGGLQAGALEEPRRFFGMARKIENGGSVTIIATVLVDTGSRMDQLIFEEFKGTGNCEIILDRRIAEARIFPAINIPASGTRKEELLYEPNQYKQVARLRRALAKHEPKEALELLLKFLNKYRTNDDFLNESQDKPETEARAKNEKARERAKNKASKE